jgi:hypothetical protein
MALLTTSRNTPELSDGGRIIQIGVEAATSIYVGGLVALDANGYAVPAQLYGAAPLNVLSVIGVCEYVYAGGVLPPGLNALNLVANALLYPQVSNVGAAGAIAVGVRRIGVFAFDYDATITGVTNLGPLVFANDDHTVSLADGSGATTVPNTTSFVLPASGTPQLSILKPYIQPGSVNAYSATGGGGTHYVENTDFSIDYQAGQFQAIPGGAIAAGATVFITYKYGFATKPAVGRLVAVDSQFAWVDVTRPFLNALNAAGLQN